MSRTVLIFCVVLSTMLIIQGCSDSDSNIAGPGGGSGDDAFVIPSMMDQMTRVMPITLGSQALKSKSAGVYWPGGDGNQFVVSIFDTSGSGGTDMLIYYGAAVADNIASLFSRRLTAAALQGQAGSDTIHVHAQEGLVILDVSWEQAPASVPLHPQLNMSPRTDFQVKVTCFNEDFNWDFEIYYGLTPTGDVIYMVEDGGFKYAVRDFNGTSEFWFSNNREHGEYSYGSRTYVELTSNTFRAKFVRKDDEYNNVMGYFGGGEAQHIGDDIDQDNSWVAIRSYYHLTGQGTWSVYGILNYEEATDMDYAGDYPRSLEELAGDNTRSVANFITPGHDQCLFADEASVLAFFEF